MQCSSCDLDFKSYTAVSLHFRNKHGTADKFREIMRLKLVAERHEGITPTCKCGCGETPKYYDYETGYVEYVRGHHARVHNNWGHNEGALAKSHATTKARYDAGDLQVWNKGLTSGSDERVAAYGKTQSDNFTPERRDVRSKRMTSNRLSKVVPDLKGKDHGMWRGGVSSVQALSRSYVFNVWTYPKLLASGFTCQDCGVKHDLEVHHDKERFAEILQKAREVLGDVTDDFESHQAYARWVADYHTQNDVSGVVLCEQCHQERHAAA